MQRPEQAAAPTLYPTSVVAGVLDSSPARVRRLVHAVLPRREVRGRHFRFTFRELALLRAAHGLLAAGVPLLRVRRTLAALARQLPPGTPLTGVRIHADHGCIVVSDGTATWEPENGQYLLSFGVDGLRRRVRRLVLRTRQSAARRRPRPTRDSLDWLRDGLEHEENGDSGAARRAYRQALRLDPDLAEAHVNLGRLSHQEGRLRAATRCYRKALRLAPDHAIAHYNLAIASEDADRPELALEHYRAAIRLDRRLADAHFNLGKLLASRGQPLESRKHLAIYRRLTGRRR